MRERKARQGLTNQHDWCKKSCFLDRVLSLYCNDLMQFENLSSCKPHCPFLFLLLPANISKIFSPKERMDDLTEFCSVGLLAVVVVVVGFGFVEPEFSVSFFALAVGFGSVSIVLSRSSGVPISNPKTAPSNFINFGLFKSLIKKNRIEISMIEKPTLYY